MVFPSLKWFKTGMVSLIRSTRSVAAAVIACSVGLGSLPAYAQSAAGLIGAGKKAIAKGKYSEAIRHFTRAMRAEDLTPEQLARAFYQRGLAYRKSGQHAESIADITRAVWFKKLPEADRKTAFRSRALSYQALGFTQNAKSDFRVAGGQSGGQSAGQSAGNQGSRAAGGIGSGLQSGVTAGQAAAAQTATNSSGGFFGNLFGFGSASQEAPAKQAPLAGWGGAAIVKATPPAAKTKPVKSAARTPATTASVRAVAPWQTVSTRHAASAAARPSTVSGQRKYAVQIASVRSRGDAAKLWKRMKSRHGSLLARKKPFLVRADLGNKGVFYRVQIGPAADKITTRKLCEQMKAQGTYCFLVKR